MSNAAKQPLTLGWSSADLTPEARVNLVGQFNMRPSEGVLDPVTASVLVLSKCDSDAVILVSCDAVSVVPPVITGVRERLAAEAPEIPTGRMLVAATHTHTAPDQGGYWGYPLDGLMPVEQYIKFMTGRLVEAVKAAWLARKPGSVAWGYGFAVASHQRRTRYFPARRERQHLAGMKTERNVSMYGATDDRDFAGFDGGEDHSLQTLFTFDAGGKATGAVVNLPCPSQETESMYQISADFWCETRAALRQRFGEGFGVLGLCAAAGDLSPHILYHQRAEERMRELRGLSTRGEIARRIVDEVIGQFETVKETRSGDLELDGERLTLELDRRFISDKEMHEVRVALAELEIIPASTSEDPAMRLAENSSRFSRRQRCRQVMRLYDEQKLKPTLTTEAVVLRIGDLAIASDSFELFSDFGIRIQSRSPALQTMTVQLAGTPYADNSMYLATERALAGESYSANIYCNAVSPAGGQQLVEATLASLHRLFPQK